MPPWNHLHPLIVHFPIALLMFAPALVALGMLWPAQRRGIHLAALVDLAFGALSAGAALASGGAASGLAQRTPELRAALAGHQHSAQLTAGIFALLTVLFALLWFLPLVAPRACGRGTLNALLALWLVFCLAALPSLIKTGRLGGQMVHELGTHPVLSKEIP